MVFGEHHWIVLDEHLSDLLLEVGSEGIEAEFRLVQDAAKHPERCRELLALAVKLLRRLVLQIAALQALVG